MNRSLLERARTFLQAQRKNRMWHRALRGAAVVVVFITTYMLILPAITMERPAICGKEEHTHTEECYSPGKTERTLNCQVKSENPIIHIHDANCYDESGTLVCQLPEVREHVHTDECYTLSDSGSSGAEFSESPGDGEPVFTDGSASAENAGTNTGDDENGQKHLMCGLPEIVYHVHDADCCDSQGNLICGKPEIIRHQHTDECFTETVSQPELICGKEEHQHTEECYAPEKTEEPEVTKEPNETEEPEPTVTPEETKEPEPTEMPEVTEIPEPTGIQKGTLVHESIRLLGNQANEGTENSTNEGTTPELTPTPKLTPTPELTPTPTPAPGPVNVEYYITETGTKLSYRTEGHDWTEVTTDTTLPGNADLRLDVAYANVPLDTLLSNGGRLTYTVPSLLRDPKANGTITASDNSIIGNVSVNGNVLTIDFDDTWLQGLKDKGNTTLSGTFYVGSQINLSEVGGGGGKQLIIGPVTIQARFDTDIIAKNGNVDINKSVSNLIQTETGDYLEYTLTVTAGQDGCPDVKVVDSFTANANYVSYVGLNNALTALTGEGSPAEKIDEGKSHGSVYKGTAPTTENPIPTVAGGEETPGSLVWVIGDMAASETRTLTYRVKLKNGYTYIQNSGNKFSNQAQIYSKTYPRDKSTVNYEPKAGLDMKKLAQENVVRQEDGSYLVTYRVWVQAKSDNNFTLKNVRIEDSLNHQKNPTKQEILPYISYVDGSFGLYDNIDAVGNPLGFHTNETITSNPQMNADKKGFTAYVGDMAPGTIRCMKYQVRVDLQAIGESGGQILDIKNRAIAYADNAKMNDKDWLQAYSSTKTIKYDHWVKKLVGDPLPADETVSISGSVYDATGDSPVIVENPDQSFTAPVGSYRYTVTVNDLGDWDVTSAVMKDSLGNQYMQFVGYVKVDAVEPEIDTVRHTVWVKVDGTRNFNFTLAQLGLSPNKYKYNLTYYAKPVQVDGVSAVVVSNEFKLDGGTIGTGSGYTFIPTGITAEASVTIQGGHSFEAQKMAWYYDGATESSGSWANGALYWAIKVDGTAFLAGTALQDYIKPNNNKSNLVIRNDSLIGLYTAEFPQGKALTDYKDMNAAINSGYMHKIEENAYTATLGNSKNLSGNDSFSELTICMNQTITLGESKSLYIILKTALTSPLNNRDAITFTNYLKSSDDGTTWQDRGSASKTLYGGSNILKEVGCTFNYDGKKATPIKKYRDFNIAVKGLSKPGFYVAWAVKVNYAGDLSGRYRVVDDIPDGMELGYARIKWRGKNAQRNPGAQMVQISNLDGWTEHTMTADLDGQSALTSWYYTKNNQVCWEVDNLIAGHEKDNCSVDFQVVCRVTDPEVLLGGAEKSFNNQVRLYTQSGEELDSDSNSVTVSTSTMNKSKVNGGSVIPFTITVNPLGEDLLAGKDTVTIVDELSNTLKLDVTSITTVNSKTPQEQVDFSASLEGQTLKITVPDGQPLTIGYNAVVQTAPGTSVSIKNVAHWEGYEEKGGSSVEEKNYSYSVGGTAGGSGLLSVTVVKYDQFNVTTHLAGAEFEMTEGTLNNGKFTPVDGKKSWTGTTDSDGKLSFGDASHPMFYNTVYQIIEKKAPQGYVLDSTPRYFLLAKADESGTYPPYPGGVSIFYGSHTCTLEIANHKGEVTVEKVFKDSEGASVDKIDGTYSFGIYEKKDPTGDPLQKVSITFKNGSLDRQVMFTNLKLGQTYYIYELDYKGQPIRNGQTAIVDGKQFDVSYSSGSNSVTIPDNGNISDKNVAKVTVTNKVNYPELPETGGSGTTLIYIIGAVFVLVAAVLLALKRKYPKA